MSRFVFSLLLCICSCYGKIDINSYLKTCDRNSPDVNDCLVEAIQEGLAVFSGGIPELDLAPVDPYRQDEIRVDYKKNQIIARMVMKDIAVRGLKDAKVHDVRLKADEGRFHLEADLTSPKVLVTGSYFGEGRFNALKVNATGKFNSTMRDLVYTWKLDGKPEKKEDGETYIRITSFYMRPDVGDLTSYATGIFPNNPELTQLANDLANQNWRLLYREMLPYAQANWNIIGTSIANKIFLQIPYDQLFPVKS